MRRFEHINRRTEILLIGSRQYDDKEIMQTRRAQISEFWRVHL